MRIVALLSLFTFLFQYCVSIALAADVGIFVRAPSTITSPVVNRTYAIDPLDGKLKRYGASTTWEDMTLPRINLFGVGAPGVSNDVTQQYYPGSIWFHTSAKQIYVCLDNATGAAVWSIYSNRISAADIQPKLHTIDLASDWLVSGLIGSDPGATLAMTTPSGIGYAAGIRVTAGPFANTYTASKDTYEYLQTDGTMLRVAVNNGAAAPTGQPGLALQMVVTNGTEITGVTQLAPTAPKLSILAATAAAHAINLGQADARYAPISVYTSQSQNLFYGSPDGTSGLPIFRALLNNDLPIVSLAKGGSGANLTANALGLIYMNGSSMAVTSAPSALQTPRVNAGGTGWEFYSNTSGTVTSVAVTAPNDLLGVTGSPITTSGTIALAKVAVAANKVYKGPNSGGDANPTFASLVNGDLPIVDNAHGGTNANLTPTNLAIVHGTGSALGMSPAAGALQSWRVNAGATALEAYTPATPTGGFGGGGSDGALTKGAVTETTVQGWEATTFTQSASTTYTVKSGTRINCTSTCTVNGTLDVSKDFAYTPSAGGSGLSPGYAGGGAGNGGAGGGCGDATSGSGAAICFNTIGGSSGGYGTGCAGGAGAGCVRICAVGNITIASGGTITAIGGNGVNSGSGNGGGGGSGGVVALYSQASITQTGNGSVAGGNGGNTGAANAGGGGGGGFYFRMSPSNTGAGTITLTGGTKGTGTGGNGADGVSIAITGTPNLPLVGLHERGYLGEWVAIQQKARAKHGLDAHWIEANAREHCQAIAALVARDGGDYNAVLLAILPNADELSDKFRVAKRSIGVGRPEEISELRCAA